MKKNIESERQIKFKEYNINHPLSPHAYTVDFTQANYIKAVIFNIVVQYIDFETIGFRTRTKTTHLHTFVGLTEKEFYAYLIKNDPVQCSKEKIDQL